MHVETQTHVVGSSSAYLEGRITVTAFT